MNSSPKNSSETDQAHFLYRKEKYPIAESELEIQKNYSIRTLELKADDEGPVVATLLKKKIAIQTDKAMLYIHGYLDYFFQDHLAGRMEELGYQFYALDLRKYGRSLRPHQSPNFARDLKEYDEEISEALGIIRSEGHHFIILHAHSTGGLISTLYAQSGKNRALINALLLNSPFFDVNAPLFVKLIIRLLAFRSRFSPKAHIAPKRFSSIYGRTLHKDYGGEWDYTLAWKPLKGYPIYGAWARAIKKGHRIIHKGMDLKIPILILHSTQTHRPNQLDENAKSSDIVLDVYHIKKYGATLGKQVQFQAIPDGLHDIFLSRPSAREAAFEHVAQWIKALHTS